MPDPEPPAMPSTWAAAPYSDRLRNIILAWKDADRGDLAPVLAPLLARTIAQALLDRPAVTAAIRTEQTLVIVPVPSRAAAVRARGRWPVSELVAAMQAIMGHTHALVSAPALRLASTGRDQAGLSQRDRAWNLNHAMRLDRRHCASIEGAVCMVVDDIVTTGHTLTEAARVLRSSGATTVLAATVAATARRVPR